MKMKKFMALILAGAMVMGMAACGSGKEEDTKKEAASARRDRRGRDFYYDP